MSSAGDLLRKLDPGRGGIETDLPRFGQPWHAEAFGTSLALSQAGLFSWAEWVDVFSREIRTNPQRADEDSEAAYYRQWLAALEAVLEKHATLTSAEIAETAEHWRRSYLNTPHGKPIAFSREWQDQPELEGEGHDHHHRHDDRHHHPGHAGAPRPVAISPSTHYGREVAREGKWKSVDPAAFADAYIDLINALCDVQNKTPATR